MRPIKPKHKIKTGKTKSSAILFVVICTFFTSVAQLLWKFGSANLGFSVSGILNLFIILGFLSYGIGAVLLIMALKNGELTVVYPFVSLSFIWVALLSMFFLKESLTLLNWLGIIVIVGGVSLINIGGRK